MTIPIKIKKIHFLALFFIVVGVLYVVRLIHPEYATPETLQNEAALFAQNNSEMQQTEDSLMANATETLTNADAEAEDEEETPNTNDERPNEMSITPEENDRILRHSKTVDALFQAKRAEVKLVDHRGRPVKNKIKGVSSYVRVFNDLNDVQIATASRVGIARIANRDEAMLRKDSLVFIGNSPYYDVKKLTHSIPYLVPRAAICLEEIARAFMDSCVAKGLPMHKVVLTSVLRTESDVAKLRRVNVNASQNSCHQHGTTFDISYNHFKMVQNPYTAPQREIPATKLKQILAEVLEDQRDMGTCFVKYEYRRSACFHITAR